MDNYDVTIVESELKLKHIEELKTEVAKDAWIELKKYFKKQGSGASAKVACVVIGTLAREMQANNNSRQLDLVEKKLKITGDDTLGLPSPE